MTPAQRPNTIIASEEGELLNILGAPMAVRLADPAASLFVARHTTPPGFMVPPHKHEDDDEAFYILEGTLTLLGADGETTATAGDFAFLPCGSASATIPKATWSSLLSAPRAFNRLKCSDSWTGWRTARH